MKPIIANSELIHLYSNPLIKAFFDSDIAQHFGAITYARGQDLAHSNQVLEISDFNVFETGSFRFSSVVGAGGQDRYHQEIVVNRVGKGWSMKSSCNCSRGEGCHHVAAATVALTELFTELGSNTEHLTELWFNEASQLQGQASAKPSLRERKSLVGYGFQINEKGLMNIFCGEFSGVSFSNDSHVLIEDVGKPLNRDLDSFDADDLDRSIIPEIGYHWNRKEHTRLSSEIEYLALDFDGALNLLNRLLQTKRFFRLLNKVGSSRRSSSLVVDARVTKSCFSLGCEIVADLVWKTETDKNNGATYLRPLVEFARDGEPIKVVPFQVEKPCYLNLEDYSIGPLSLPSWANFELLVHWASAPRIKQEEAALISPKIKKKELRPPIKEVSEVLIDDVFPRPVLVMRETPAICADSEVDPGRIELFFDYDDHRVTFLKEALEDPKHIPSEERVIRKRPVEEGGKLVVKLIKRDFGLEVAYAQSLLRDSNLRWKLDLIIAELAEEIELGIVSTDEIDTLADPNELALNLSIDDEADKVHHEMFNFQLNILPKLKQDGWLIEDEWQLGDIQVVESSNPIVDFHEDEETNEWFQFECGVVDSEGKRHSLIDQLARYLENYEDFPTPREAAKEDEFIFLTDPINQLVFKVNRQQFYAIGRAVKDFLLRPGEPVHKVRAADVAETLKLDETSTLRALSDLGKNLANSKHLPPVKVPRSVNADLRVYQEEGFRWMQFLARSSLQGVLADDMGLGKTLQTLSHLQAEIEQGHHFEGTPERTKSGRISKASIKNLKQRPSLVVAPTSVVSNWVNEAKKFTPNLQVLALRGPERRQWFDQFDQFHLVITSYALLNRDIESMVKTTWQLVVLDEAQYIKNAASKVSQNVCKLPSKQRICLSGTPLENHLGELWALFRFLMPGFLGSAEVFGRNFRRPIERDDDGDAREALAKRVRPLIMRRTKSEVATELPPKTEIVHQIELNKSQVNLYESVRAAMDHKVQAAIAAKGEARSQIIFLEALLKLRQICCDPRLYDPAATGKGASSAKLEFLSKELLPTLIEENRKILLFSQFTTMLGFIEKELKEMAVDYIKLTGSSKNRGALVDQFQNGEAPVFLISLKAGGTGLNLTAADTVIHYDPWWNPAAENQATDRAYRIGQDKPVFVHRLICAGTIEERIQTLQKRKAKIAEAILSRSSKTVKLDSETLGHLLAPIE